MAIRIRYQGREYALRELQYVAKIPCSTLYKRIVKQGMSVEDAVTIEYHGKIGTYSLGRGEAWAEVEFKRMHRLLH